MPSTYTPIATQTLSTTTTTVTFSSISGTYTDLILVVSPLTTNANAAVQIRFNSDTGSNYSRTYMSGNGSSASTASAGGLNESSIGFSSDNTTPYTIVTQIQSYSNTNIKKTYLSRSAGSEVLEYTGLWNSSSAITTIALYPSSSGSFTSGSTFTLYGIKAA